MAGPKKAPRKQSGGNSIFAKNRKPGQENSGAVEKP